MGNSKSSQLKQELQVKAPPPISQCKILQIKSMKYIPLIAEIDSQNKISHLRSQQIKYQNRQIKGIKLVSIKKRNHQPNLPNIMQHAIHKSHNTIISQNSKFSDYYLAQKSLRKFKIFWLQQMERRVQLTIRVNTTNKKQFLDGNNSSKGDSNSIIPLSCLYLRELSHKSAFEFTKQFKKIDKISTLLIKTDINDGFRTSFFLNNTLKICCRVECLKLEISQSKMGQIKQFSKNLSRFKSLRVLYLNISYNRILNDGIHDIGEAISQLQQLEHFDFRCQENIILTSGANLFLSKLALTQSLHTLKLDLSKNGFTNTTAIGIGRYLRQLTQIKHLAINFTNNDLSNNEILEIYEGVFKITQLESLEYKLNHKNISQDCLCVLGYAMQKSPQQLKCLKLNFSNRLQSKDSFKRICLGIQKFSPTLEILCLNFKESKVQGIDNLGQCLADLKQLASLELNLDLNKIGKGISTIGNSLKNMNLTSLILSIESNNIGSNSAKELLNGIFSNYRLVKLVLNAYSNDLDGKNLSYIAQNLCKLEELQEVYFDFSENKLQNQGVIDLETALKQKNLLSRTIIQYWRARQGIIHDTGFTYL